MNPHLNFKSLSFIALACILCLGSCKESTVETTEDFPTPSTGAAMFDDASNKTWKHRVNTLDDVKASQTDFTGVELDVFFDTLQQKFIVKHDLEDPSTLDLETYFNAFENLEGKYFWIDVKGLQMRDVSGIYQSHLLFDSLFDIGDRLIYESGNTIALKSLHDYGMHTSYWIPHFDFTNEEEMTVDNYITEISAKLKHCPHNAISAHYTMLPFIQTYFPECNTHLWTNGLIQESEKDTIRAMLKYDNVKVVLIDYSAPL